MSGKNPRLGRASLDLFFVGILMMFAGCGMPTASDVAHSHVIGGTPVSANDAIYRQVAELSVQKGSEWYSCTGTLIAPDVILTAAHCIQGQRNPIVLATIAKKSRRSTQVAIHPQYNASALQDVFTLRPANDIALVKLALPFVDFQPAPVAAAPTSVGTALRIAGHGEDEQKNTGVLKAANTTVSEYRLSTKDVVAKVGRVATAFGDSGGPAFTCHAGICTVVGVISRTINMRREDVFTSVYEARGWLHATMKSWQQN